MLIDVLMLILCLLGIYKGLKRGFVVAIFSIIALVVGLVVAFKTFEWVAIWLKAQTALSVRWLSFIAFLLVLIAVIIVVHLLANVLQHTLEMLWMGMLNKVLGAALYVFMYVSIGAIIIFYATQLPILNSQTRESSKTLGFIHTYVPVLLHKVASVVPFLESSLQKLQSGW
jgi:membrane protein required for colicin V production